MFFSIFLEEGTNSFSISCSFDELLRTTVFLLVGVVVMKGCSNYV